MPYSSILTTAGDRNTVGGETAELYRKAAEGDSLAKSMLVQLWLPKVIETAKENAHPRFLPDGSGAGGKCRTF